MYPKKTEDVMYKTLKKVLGPNFEKFKESVVATGCARMLAEWLEKEADTQANVRSVDFSQSDSAKMLADCMARSCTANALTRIASAIRGKR